MLATIIQNILNALQWGSFYALIALGYTLVYGVLTLINFAHGDIFMVGAYIAFFVATFLLTAAGLPGWAALVLVIPLTMILTSAVGVTLERVAYRPLRRKGANRLYVVITALMAGLMLEHGNLALLGASRKAFPAMIPETVYNVGGVSFTNLKLAVILTAILVFVLLHFIVTKTRVGMAMRAISYDKFAVPLMGIPIDTIIVATFVLGSSFAGLAGILFAMSYPVLEPYMGALIGWKAFIAAVVGGIGDIRGAFLGGFLLGAVEILVVAVFPSTFRDLLAFTVLLVILTFKPTGLFGVAKTTKI
ncbi:branched-chain amino acid ABC transporter permease [Desulfuromonas versatilis]|uniref:Branched-chain amino acid ABC transporter permease n=1 Tax=Desulfuromonas versatilis TaxID=2802975 RepID=A0ABM8HT67_9BACT|nr:branched-chain amino acid ABC transporter permease [Desulfuromonas versatilis]BCR03887.1 branched-chain amino acid ABC transporter permease [Desulfuromonas versatilis]